VAFARIKFIMQDQCATSPVMEPTCSSTAMLVRKAPTGGRIAHFASLADPITAAFRGRRSRKGFGVRISLQTSPHDPTNDRCTVPGVRQCTALDSRPAHMNRLTEIARTVESSAQNDAQRDAPLLCNRLPSLPQLALRSLSVQADAVRNLGGGPPAGSGSLPSPASERVYPTRGQGACG